MNNFKKIIQLKNILFHRNINKKSLLNFSQLYLFFILIITYIPIILTVVYSFNASRISSIWSETSLIWYRELFHSPDLIEATLNSLILAFSTAIISAIIAVSGAISIVRKKNFLGISIEYVSLLPIMIPEIILAIGFLVLFSMLNFPFGMITLIIAHTSFCVPYIFILVKNRLLEQETEIEDAARDLGASHLMIFKDITLPYLMPSIASGMLLAFAMSFDDVIISIFVTGTNVNTLPIKIYTKIKSGITPEINALITIMLFMVISVLIAYHLFIYKRSKNTIQ